MKAIQLSFAFESRTVLEEISFEIAPGEAAGIVGANGSGKSTLLWCLAGLLRPAGGQVIRPAGTMSMVFQNPEDQLFMPTLLQDLGLPLLNSGFTAEEARNRASAALRECGLETQGERPAHHLSLGQRKRAAIALALVREPQLLLLDEPTAELDGRSVRHLSALLRALPAAKLVASHDLGFLKEVTTRLLVLLDGRIVAEGPTGEILGNRELLLRAGLI